MRRWIPVLGLVLAVLVGGGVVLAQPASPAPPPADLPRVLARARAQLNLTDDQVRRLSEAFRSYRTRTERVRLDLARARLDLREAFLSPSPDRARVEGIARRMGALQGQLTQARVELLLEIRAILTPEQAARLRSLWRWYGVGHRPARRTR